MVKLTRLLACETRINRLFQWPLTGDLVGKSFAGMMGGVLTNSFNLVAIIAFAHFLCQLRTVEYTKSIPLIPPMVFRPEKAPSEAEEIEYF